MNDAVLIQQVFPGGGFEPILELTQERHAAYCAAHGFDYRVYRDNGQGKCQGVGGWPKVPYIQQALQEFRYVVYIDVDAFIEDTTVDLREACQGVGAVKFLLPTGISVYNVGALYFRAVDAAQDFIKRWLAGFPGNEHDTEQGVFNTLAGITELPSRWNYTVDRHFDHPRVVVRGYHSIRGIKSKYNAVQNRLAGLANG